MQSVENHTDLVGTVRARRPHPHLPDFDLLHVEVEQTAPVGGMADLLSSTVGQELQVTVRRALLDDKVGPGVSLRCPARRTPDGAMADTYPEPGSFVVTGTGADVPFSDATD